MDGMAQLASVLDLRRAPAEIDTAYMAAGPLALS